MVPKTQELGSLDPDTTHRAALVQLFQESQRGICPRPTDDRTVKTGETNQSRWGTKGSSIIHGMQTPNSKWHKLAPWRREIKTNTLNGRWTSQNLSSQRSDMTVKESSCFCLRLTAHISGCFRSDAGFIALNSRTCTTVGFCLISVKAYTMTW